MTDSSDKWVAVTGIGMICPLGTSTDECWRNFVAGKSGIRKITRFDASECLTQIAGEIPEKYFSLERETLSRENYRHSTLAVRLSIMSTLETLRDAQFDLEDNKNGRTAVISGCGSYTVGDGLIYRDSTLNRYIFAYDAMNNPAARVSIEFGFNGPSFNVATACASGAYAIGLGYDYVLRTGHPCISIGVECVLFKETIDGFNQVMALSEESEFPEKASRPFEQNRTGFVLSEGVCSVLLEPYQHAVQRGADIYAIMPGYAFISEAFNILAPEPEGREIAYTMESAVENAGIDRSRIGYINAHGTSTLYNDLAETKAIKSVFSQKAYKIPVSSQKSMIGHSIGAAGAIEFAITALSLKHQILTPTINYDRPDPECDLDYVPNQSRPARSLEASITNSFGFGGHNASIVLVNNEAV